MKENYIFNVRVTGILIENGKILIVQQNVSKNRAWSLPGGRLERGESLADCLIREMKEETGLEVKIDRLLYVCDVEASGNTILHITFLVTKTGGNITLPTNEFDENPIHDVKFVPLDSLSDYGFSEHFVELAKQGFPNSGNYMGDKKAIGLGN